MESCACASLQSANWTLEASTSSDSGYTIYAREIDARWIPGVQEGVRLHFSGIRGRFVRLSSETEMVLCEVEIYGTGIYHDEENDCKICPYGKYQDQRGQDYVKVVPKPMVQDIELTVDEESFVNFPALQCSHEWNAQTSPAVYPLHMSSMPWNVDITYVDARPKNDPNAARLRISRPGTLENAESVQNGGISYGYLNLWDENVKLNYEASGASSVFTITYKCSFSINTIPYDTSEPTSSDASKYFQPASFDTSYPIAYSIEKNIKIIVNDINEAPSITFQLAGLDGNGKMNETAAQNFIVANFACANDPEMERCGGCSGMTYGCSGNGSHTSWGNKIVSKGPLQSLDKFGCCQAIIAGL